MSKHDKVPSTLMLQIGEYIVPTMIAFAVILSIILTYYAVQKVTNPAITSNITPTILPTVVDADPYQMTVLKQGKGTAVVKKGNSITVNYKGTLKKDGFEFDSTYKKDRKPFTFIVGANSVIQGWEQGVLGMKVGEKRKLQIPASLGYGAAGQGAIPPNATLIFEIELLKID